MTRSDSNYSASKIATTGRWTPTRFIENEVIETRCNLEPGWIERRTGILQRPTVSDNEAVSDLAVAAGKVALDRYDGEIQIGMVILATSTPDFLLPPTAPQVATRLGLANLPAFDIAVACCGFLYALQLADGFCRTNHKAVLVVAANVLSRRVSKNDPATAAIFADGAGATLVVPSGTPGILSLALESDGSGAEALQIPHGGSRHPIDETTLENDLHKMKVNNGMAVYRYAVESMSKLGQQVIDEAGVSADEIDFWIPHQANLRIVDSVRQRLVLPEKKTGITIDRFANSSAATIPMALDLFLEEGRISAGDLVLMTAAAAGLTSGAVLLRL